MGWWPAEDWARMVAGDGCPMCADGHRPRHAHGELIAELPGSYARLATNQTHAGYTVVIAKRHAAELHDLTAEELRLFFADVAAVGRTLAALFQPVKIDSFVYGHLCPHVHCHVYPQYAHDDPHAPVDPQAGDVRLDEEAWAERVAAMRAHLDAHHRPAS